MSKVASMSKEMYDQIQDDCMRGRLSDIPDCCIAFFTQVWSPLVMAGIVAEINNYWFNKWKTDYAPIIANWGYIPCPLCKVQGNRVEIIRHEPAKVRKRKR